MNKNVGHLEVIAGPMYSGKTEELIRRITRAKIAKKQVQTFNHAIDTRYGTEKKIYSHNGFTVSAVRVQSASEILKKIKSNTDMAAIDEAQWFGVNLIDVAQQLVQKGKRVIISGLALTYDRTPFPPIPDLMALADKVTKLTAICMICGSDAMYHKRLIETNKINPLDPSPTLVGHSSYEARCRNCFDM